jgi:hypothetical protein
VRSFFGVAIWRSKERWWELVDGLHRATRDDIAGAKGIPCYSLVGEYNKEDLRALGTALNALNGVKTTEETMVVNAVLWMMDPARRHLLDNKNEFKKLWEIVTKSKYPVAPREKLRSRLATARLLDRLTQPGEFYLPRAAGILPTVLREIARTEIVEVQHRFCKWYDQLGKDKPNYKAVGKMMTAIIAQSTNHGQLEAMEEQFQQWTMTPAPSTNGEVKQGKDGAPIMLVDDVPPPGKKNPISKDTRTYHRSLKEVRHWNRPLLELEPDAAERGRTLLRMVEIQEQMDHHLKQNAGELYAARQQQQAPAKEGG